MPYFKVKEESRTKKLVDYSMPPVLDASEVGYDNTTSGLSATKVQGAIDELADEKVDKVSGKGLSTNDYTTTEKDKLAGIAAGAQVNSITGVKGNAESSYRTGNINLTPANLGAAAATSVVTSITRSGTTFTAKNSAGTQLFTFTQQDNNTTTGTTYAAGSCPNNTTFGTNGSIANVYNACVKTSGGDKLGNLTVAGGSHLGCWWGNNFVGKIFANSSNWVTYQNLANGGNVYMAQYHDFKSYNGGAWVNISARGFVQQSSRRYKENIKCLNDSEALKLLDVDVVSYDYKKEFQNDDDRCDKVGVIAEDVVDEIPNVVTYREIDGEILPDGVDYSKFTPYLIKLCQIQQQEIDDLNRRLEALESK